MPKIKHQLRTHPLYRVWLQMRYRCNSAKSPDYKNYGGRGVKICNEWGDFKVFYDWCIQNGWQKGLQLDKDIKARQAGIEPLLYSPDSCSFVTIKANTQNSRKAKLDIIKVEEIRNSDKRTKELMQIYNVSRRTINSVKAKTGWI